MRLVKTSRKLLLLALPWVSVTSVPAQVHPLAPVSNVRDQLRQVPATGSSPAPASAVGKPTPAGSEKTSTPIATGSAKTDVDAAGTHKSAGRRDPFDTLINKAHTGNGVPDNLPPGKAGLIVGTLHIDGVIHSSNGMIAIVSNPQQRVYFLHEGDKVFDGAVEHITLEAVSFQEFGKDAFGKPLQRQVTKRLYPSPGEQR